MLRKLFLTVLLVTCLTGMVYGQVVYENACESLDGTWQYQKQCGGSVALDSNGKTGNCLKMEMASDGWGYFAVCYKVELEPFSLYEVSAWIKGDIPLRIGCWQYSLLAESYVVEDITFSKQVSWTQKKARFTTLKKPYSLFFCLNLTPGAVYIDDISLTKIEDVPTHLASQQAIVDDATKTEAEKDNARRILGQAQYLNSGKITILESIVTKNAVEYEWLGDKYRDQADEALPAQMKALYFKSIRANLKAKGILGKNPEPNKAKIDKLNKKNADIGETIESLMRMGL